MQEIENTIKINKNEILFREGDLARDLYKVSEGRLLVCVQMEDSVSPIAYIKAGDYLGELSFFEHRARSANVIAVENSTLIKIPQAELNKQCPKWFSTLAKFMSKKIRMQDDVIAENGIKKANKSSIVPLTPDEQRHYFQLLNF